MKKGVLKISACALAGTIVFSGSATVFAACDTPLAGIGAEIIAKQEKKEAAGVRQVAATGYDVMAIAQVSEYVNIRDEASTETGKIVGKLYNNAAAEILGQTDGWYLIRSGDVVGYVSSEFFATGEEAEELAAQVGTEIATVNTETLMVRAEASQESDVLTFVGDSQELEVLDEEEGWVKVAVDNDVVGYVSEDYVTCETQFVEAESIAASNAREDAVQSALDRAQAMKDAAIEAMNNADADEAAYAASQASAAAAEAKQLAAEQTLDYGIQDIAAAAVSSAEEAQYAAYMAEQYEEAARAQAAAEAAAAAAETPAAASEAGTQQAEDTGTAEAATTAAETPADTGTAQAAAQPEAAEETAAVPETTFVTEPAADAFVTDSGAVTDLSVPDTTTEPTTTSSSSSLRESVVNYALQFVGNPYVYGGTSLTNGTDCSGFTQSVLAHFGISIPRTAASQACSGTAVSVSAVQPGDLLFYDNGGGIGHVAMYIGNGQVVHASNSRTGIIVSSMNYRTPCCARSYL